MQRTLVATTVLVCLATSGCVTKKKYGALESQYENLDKRYSAIQSSESGLRLQMTDLEDQLQILQDSNVYLSSFYTDLVNEFRPQLDGNDLTVLVYPDRTSLALSDDVTFATGSAKVSDEGKATLRKLAELLARHPDRRFQIEGHTDSRPIHNAVYTSNWDLGAARAVAVVQELVADGAPADKLSAATYAENSPISTNEVAKGMDTNRRVEISFQPTLDEMPGHEALLQAAANVVYAPGASKNVPEPQPKEPKGPSANILEE